MFVKDIDVDKLSEEQLKAIAYKVCELRGINPECVVTKPSDYGDLMLYVPAWESVMDEIKPIAEVILAMNSVAR